MPAYGEPVEPLKLTWRGGPICQPQCRFGVDGAVTIRLLALVDGGVWDAPVPPRRSLRRGQPVALPLKGIGRQRHQAAGHVANQSAQSTR